jgi:hypothetical protein
MDGYEVVTADDEKVGTVVGETGDYLIVEHGTLRKSKHAVPRAFAKIDEHEQQVRITVPKDHFYDSPKLDGEDFDQQVLAEHYGIASGAPAPGTEGLGATVEGDPSRSSEEQARRDGVTPAAEQRAQIREGAMGSGLPDESPALLGDRLAGAKESER